MMSVQSSLVMLPISEFGTEAMKEKYLPKLANGRVDRLLRPRPSRTTAPIPAACITRAKKVAGGWSLTRHQDVDLEQPDRRRLRDLGQGR